MLNHPWFVVLWIGNQETLVIARRIPDGDVTYSDLAEVLLDSFGKNYTPYWVSFINSDLDMLALDECAFRLKAFTTGELAILLRNDSMN